MLGKGNFLTVGQGLSLAFFLAPTLDLAGHSGYGGFQGPLHCRASDALRGEPAPTSMTTSVLAPFTNDVASFFSPGLTSKSHSHVFPSHILELVSLHVAHSVIPFATLYIREQPF